MIKKKKIVTQSLKITSWLPASVSLLRRRGRKGLMEEKMESPEVEGGRERGRMDGGGGRRMNGGEGGGGREPTILHPRNNHRWMEERRQSNRRHSLIHQRRVTHQGWRGGREIPQQALGQYIGIRGVTRVLGLRGITKWCEGFHFKVMACITRDSEFCGTAAQNCYDLNSIC